MAKFREEIEAIRMRLSNRIDVLTVHCEEYKEEKDFERARDCDLKSRTLYMVLNDIDKALLIEI